MGKNVLNQGTIKACTAYLGALIDNHAQGQPLNATQVAELCSINPVYNLAVFRLGYCSKKFRNKITHLVPVYEKKDITQDMVTEIIEFVRDYWSGLQHTRAAKLEKEKELEAKKAFVNKKFAEGEKDPMNFEISEPAIKPAVETMELKPDGRKRDTVLLYFKPELLRGNIGVEVIVDIRGDLTLKYLKKDDLLL